MLIFFKFQIFPKVLKVLLTPFYPRFYTGKNDLKQWFKSGKNWVLSTIKLRITPAKIKYDFTEHLCSQRDTDIIKQSC